MKSTPLKKRAAPHGTQNLFPIGAAQLWEDRQMAGFFHATGKALDSRLLGGLGADKRRGSSGTKLNVCCLVQTGPQS